MEHGFDYLRCPMCGGELVYSEGTHDLSCRNNPYERESAGAERGTAEEAAARGAALHEGAADYSPGSAGAGGRNGPGTHGPRADEEKSRDASRQRRACTFALSFTESGRYGTLWSVRTVDRETNYFWLMRLMQKIEKRHKTGEPLAPNAPHPPRKKERTAAERLAFRYGVGVEDLYSIRYSSETAERLARFYGISVGDVRNIKKTEVEG